MSAHALLNLLNELGKTTRCEVLPSILSVFPNGSNKFNNASFYLSYDTKIDFYSLFAKNVKISPLDNAMFLWPSKHNVTK